MSPTEIGEFRRRLVGLNDPVAHPSSSFDTKAIRKEAVAFVRILADLYRRSHDSDDRKSIWDHIVKAISAAGAAVSPDDFAGFACNCLPHIQCDPATAACHEQFQQRIAETRPAEWHEAVMRYLTGPMMAAAVGFARNEDLLNKTPRKEDAPNASAS